MQQAQLNQLCKGDYMSFPQDVVNIATILPLELDELCGSVRIIFFGSRIANRDQ